jgi:hypothetical protein
MAQTYKNLEMRKAMQQMKPAQKPIKIISGSASTREPFETSQRRAGSMVSSGTPRTTTSDNKNVNKLYGRIGGNAR